MSEFRTRSGSFAPTLSQLREHTRLWAEHYGELSGQAIEADTPAHAVAFATAQLWLESATASIGLALAALDRDLGEGT